MCAVNTDEEEEEEEDDLVPTTSQSSKKRSSIRLQGKFCMPVGGGLEPEACF